MNPAPNGPSKPRSLHLCHALRVGGLERVVVDLARTGRRRGHDDRILLFDSDRVDPVTDLDPEGVPVAFAMRRRGIDPSCTRRIAKLVRDLGARVLHAHNDTALVYAAAALPQLRARERPRLIATFHNLPVHDTRASRVLTRVAGRFAAALVAVSDDLGAALAERGWTRPTVTIHNGVDAERYAPATRGEGAGLRVGCLARLRPGKRHDLLLRAAAALIDAGHDVRVTITGEDTGDAEIARRIAALPHARWLPFVRDVPALYGELDAAVVLSDHEGSPLALLEAMAAGLPVVASAVGGIPEIARDRETALLVPNDATAVTRALEELLDPELRAAIGARARRHAVESHSLDRTAERYDAIYAG